MKKILTAIAMFGVALTSQATIVVTPSDGGTTLTISADAGDDFNQYYQNNIQNANPSWAGNVTKLVLTGEGFTNKDLGTEGKIPDLIQKCTGYTDSNKKQLYLDLTGCVNMVSKAVPSGSNPIDWEDASTYTFEPQSKQVTVPVQEAPDYWLYSEGDLNVDMPFQEGGVPTAQSVWDPNARYICEDGVWYLYPFNGGKQSITHTAYVYEDEFGKTHKVNLDQCTNTGNGYTYTYMTDGTAFNLQKIKEKDILSGISFPASDNFTAIPREILNNTSIQKVVIPDNVITIEQSAFQSCKNLTDITFGSGLENIGEKAFEQAGITGTFEIPASVKIIRKDAFKECSGLVNIIIPAESQLTHIYESAFLMENTSNLKNVYVNCDKYIEADKGAFGFQSTDGQTQTGTVTTRLHYPANYFEEYVGAYKSEILGGLFETQEQRLANRNYARAESSVTGVDGNTYTNTSYPLGNGWWELLSTGVPVPYNPNWPVNYNDYWRTYSSFVDLVVPEGFNESDPYDPNRENITEGKGINVYLVDGYDADNDKAILVRMKVGDCIPANTGVILHWRLKVKDTSGGFIFFAPADEDNPGFGNDPYDNELYPDNKYKGYKNYMKPLNTRGASVLLKNVEKEKGVPQFRNFFWGNSVEYNLETSKDWRGEEFSDADAVVQSKGVNSWGFYRVVQGRYTINEKAYLHFPASVYSNDKGAGIGQNHDTDTNNANSFGFVIIDGGENPTGINNVTDTKVATDNSYYTLQGVKVTNPKESGIYIHNGKKIIVK
jgi:hypothetical protein